MDIKVGDIVRYNGHNVRVLRISSYILLSYFGLVHDGLDNLELIESYDPSKFEVGDRVIILDIPNRERMHYGSGWRSDSNDWVNPSCNGS